MQVMQCHFGLMLKCMYMFALWFMEWIFTSLRSHSSSHKDNQNVHVRRDEKASLLGCWSSFFSRLKKYKKSSWIHVARMETEDIKSSCWGFWYSFAKNGWRMNWNGRHYFYKSFFVKKTRRERKEQWEGEG